MSGQVVSDQPTAKMRYTAGYFHKSKPPSHFHAARSEQLNNRWSKQCSGRKFVTQLTGRGIVQWRFNNGSLLH